MRVETWQVSKPNAAKRENVSCNWLTRTEKLHLDIKIYFDNYIIKLFSIVSTALNSADLNAELTKRIELTADENCVLTNVCVLLATPN